MIEDYKQMKEMTTEFFEDQFTGPHPDSTLT